METGVKDAQLDTKVKDDMVNFAWFVSEPHVHPRMYKFELDMYLRSLGQSQRTIDH